MRLARGQQLILRCGGTDAARQDTPPEPVKEFEAGRSSRVLPSSSVVTPRPACTRRRKRPSYASQRTPARRSATRQRAAGTQRCLERSAAARRVPPASRASGSCSTWIRARVPCMGRRKGVRTTATSPRSATTRCFCSTSRATAWPPRCGPATCRAPTTGTTYSCRRLTGSRRRARAWRSARTRRSPSRRSTTRSRDATWTISPWCK